MYSGDVGDLFDGRGVFTLLPKVQLHVSAFKKSHIQVIHESLESFIFLQCHHMSFVDFVVLPPGHGRSVTDF